MSLYKDLRYKEGLYHEGYVDIRNPEKGFWISHHKLLAFCNSSKAWYRQKPNSGALARVKHFGVMKEAVYDEYTKPMPSNGSLHRTVFLDMPEVIHYTYSEEEVTGEEYSIAPTAISEVSSWSV